MSKQVILPEHPTDQDFAAWLAAEVVTGLSKPLSRLVETGQARWQRDPEHWTVFGLLRASDDKVLLVAYDNGRDFETSDLADEYYGKVI